MHPPRHAAWLELVGHLPQAPPTARDLPAQVADLLRESSDAARPPRRRRPQVGRPHRPGGPAGQRDEGTRSLGREREVGVVSHAPHLVEQSLTRGHAVRSAELEQQPHRAAARDPQPRCSGLPGGRQGGRDVVRHLDRVAIGSDRRRRRHAQHDRCGHPTHRSGELDPRSRSVAPRTRHMACVAPGHLCVGDPSSGPAAPRPWPAGEPTIQVQIPAISPAGARRGADYPRRPGRHSTEQGVRMLCGAVHRTSGPGLMSAATGRRDAGSTTASTVDRRPHTDRT